MPESDHLGLVGIHVREKGRDIAMQSRLQVRLIRIASCRLQTFRQSMHNILFRLSCSKHTGYYSNYEHAEPESQKGDDDQKRCLERL